MNGLSFYKPRIELRAALLTIQGEEDARGIHQHLDHLGGLCGFVRYRHHLKFDIWTELANIRIWLQAINFAHPSFTKKGATIAALDYRVKPALKLKIS